MVQQHALGVVDRHEGALATGVINLLDDRAPHEPLRWIGRRSGLSANAHHSPDRPEDRTT